MCAGRLSLRREPPLTVGNDYSIALEVESEKECGRVFNAISDGGEIEMGLQKAEWAEKFGTCSDRFGVQWMVSYTGNVEFPG